MILAEVLIIEDDDNFVCKWYAETLAIAQDWIRELLNDLAVNETKPYTAVECLTIL